MYPNPNYGYPYLTLVRTLANCIPTVRVVKIVDPYHNVHSFWSIDQADPKCIHIMDWNSQQATVLRHEMLDRLDCKDTWFEDF